RRGCGSPIFAVSLTPLTAKGRGVCGCTSARPELSEPLGNSGRSRIDLGDLPDLQKSAHISICMKRISSIDLARDLILPTLNQCGVSRAQVCKILGINGALLKKNLDHYAAQGFKVPP